LRLPPFCAWIDLIQAINGRKGDMQGQMALQRALRCMGFALCLVAGVARGEGDTSPAPKAVLADFSYSDTSGEPRDQTADHAARLKAFNEKLRAHLAEAKTYNLVTLSCQGTCPQADTSLPGLVKEALRAEADFLIFGAIRKESTLIQWAKVAVVDVRSERVITDRLVTFRGDSDEAWSRAEAYIARELAEQRKAR
jgi:hypothetical protein